MEKPKIDESKIVLVSEIIDKAASIMAEQDCENNSEAKKELDELQKNLRSITGKKKLNIKDFSRYWSCIDLETAARTALMPKPIKVGLNDEQITEIFLKIYNVEYKDEALMDYFLKVLEIETGLDNVSDYIFYPELVGIEDDSLDKVIAKLLSDRRK